MGIYAPSRSYAEARAEIENLDVLAWEGRGPVSAAIRIVTLGSVTHVALAARWGSSLMAIESREFRGGRAVLLSGEIPPSGVLWYRPRRDLATEARTAALEWARGACGAGYSYVGCLRFARRLPLVGRAVSAPAEDRASRGNRFCSELVSAAYRVAGIDLRPDLRDEETAPNDIVSSPDLELVARLLPPAAKSLAQTIG